MEDNKKVDLTEERFKPFIRDDVPVMGSWYEFTKTVLMTVVFPFRVLFTFVLLVITAGLCQVLIASFFNNTTTATITMWGLTPVTITKLSSTQHLYNYFFIIATTQLAVLSLTPITTQLHSIFTTITPITTTTKYTQHLYSYNTNNNKWTTKYTTSLQLTTTTIVGSVGFDTSHHHTSTHNTLETVPVILGTSYGSYQLVGVVGLLGQG